MKKLSMFLVSVLVCGVALAGSKYASSVTTSSAATFAAKDNGWVVKYVNARAGANGGTVDAYVRDTSVALNPQTVTSGATTNMQCVNTGIVITNSDKVIYQHASGVADYRVVASASATNIYLTTAPSSAPADGDKIYKIAQVSAFQIGQTNTDGIASVSIAGDAVIVTPKDSPLYVLCNSTNTAMTVTAE